MSSTFLGKVHCRRENPGYAHSCAKLYKCVMYVLRWLMILPKWKNQT